MQWGNALARSIGEEKKCQEPILVKSPPVSELFASVAPQHTTDFGLASPLLRGGWRTRLIFRREQGYCWHCIRRWQGRHSSIYRWPIQIWRTAYSFECRG